MVQDSHLLLFERTEIKVADLSLRQVFCGTAMGYIKVGGRYFFFRLDDMAKNLKFLYINMTIYHDVYNLLSVCSFLMITEA